VCSACVLRRLTDLKGEKHFIFVKATHALCVTMAALFVAACARKNNETDTTAAVAPGAIPSATATADTAAGTNSAAGEVSANIDVSSWNDNNVVAALEGANQAEIGLARIAERKATNTDIKDFANMLIDDHSHLLSVTKQLAQSSQLPAKSAPNDTHDQNDEGRRAAIHLDGKGRGMGFGLREP
jgi:predicted outer membrane protein